MKRPIALGFVALTDAAPLIIARERGFFESEGLDVTLRREVSWATIRDRVATGLYQGAHMLAPAMLAVNMGVGSEAASLIAPLSLSVHAAAIGVSRALGREMAALDEEEPNSAAALAQAVVARRLHGAMPITFAVVFPYSMHNYMLRHWAAEAGLDPDRDIRIVVAAPTAIVERLKAGEIDGFCVGAPWGAACESACGAQIVLHAADFWPGGPDKVLGLSGAWAEAEPENALALTRAVLRAARWADAPENAGALASLLARSDHVGASAEIIAKNLGGDGAARIRFASKHAAFPWRSHARWVLAQMMRWGQIDQACDFARAGNAYRPDLFRAAAAALGEDAPVGDIAEQGPIGDSQPSALVFDGDSLRRDAARYAINHVRR
jgi:ABC-type nitrate/sulfonate/bicarbonate transport system substrate-binding protein